jgi:hypothetical protein
MIEWMDSRLKKISQVESILPEIQEPLLLSSGEDKSVLENAKIIEEK